MNTKTYEYLIMIEEKKSITKAAECCFISQPALSQQLHHTENELGFPLFEKKGKDLVPTSDGKIVLESARKILKVEEETLNSIYQLRDTALQSVRIYIDSALSNIFLRRIWPSVLKDFPETHLNLTAGDSAVAEQILKNKSADIIIYYSSKKQNSIFDSRIFNIDPYLVTVSEKNPVSGYRSSESPDRFKLNLETVYLKENYSSEPSLQQKALAFYGIKGKKHLFMHSFQENAKILCHGTGLSVLPRTLLYMLNLPLTALCFQNEFIVYGIISHQKEEALNPLYNKISLLLEDLYHQFMPPSSSV